MDNTVVKQTLKTATEVVSGTLEIADPKYVNAAIANLDNVDWSKALEFSLDWEVVLNRYGDPIAILPKISIKSLPELGE